MMYLIHSLEHLKAYFYEDTEGDFWENEEAHAKWTRLSIAAAAATPMEWIYPHEIGRVVPAGPNRDIMWAVDEIITKETHPEYYL